MVTKLGKVFVLITSLLLLVNCGESSKKTFIRKHAKTQKNTDVIIQSTLRKQCDIKDLQFLAQLNYESVTCEVMNFVDFKNKKLAIEKAIEKGRRSKRGTNRDFEKANSDKRDDLFEKHRKRVLESKKKALDSQLKLTEDNSEEPKYTCEDQEAHALRVRRPIAKGSSEMLYVYAGRVFELIMNSENEEEKTFVYLLSYEVDGSGNKVNIEVDHKAFSDIGLVFEKKYLEIVDSANQVVVTCYKSALGDTPSANGSNSSGSGESAAGEGAGDAE